MFKDRTLTITAHTHEGVTGYRVETDSLVLWKKFDRFGCPQIEEEIHKVRVYFLLPDQILFRHGKRPVSEEQRERMRAKAKERGFGYREEEEDDQE
jgi:hypothetical protein